MARLSILAPNLLDRMRADGVAASPALGRLARALARAERRRRDWRGFEHALLALCGTAVSAPGSPPLATITAAFDNAVAVPAPGLYRADPVYLQPDPNHLILFDAPQLALDESAADALLADLNAGFEGEGVVFVRGTSAERWYVELGDIAPPVTFSPRALRGMAVEPFLPDTQGWRRLNLIMTQAQMILHQSPINDCREQAGQSPVNSIWLWGAGAPPTVGTAAPRKLYAREATTAALAGHFAIPCSVEDGALAADLAENWGNDAGDIAVVHEFEAAPGAAAAFAETVFTPALRALRARRLAEIVVRTCDAEFRLQRWHAWRVWRSPARVVAARGAMPAGHVGRLDD